MFINFHNFINKINQFPKENIPEDVDLCFDKYIGFYFKGKNEIENKDLNRKWKLWLSSLNKEAGIQEYLTVIQIAEHLHVSNNTVYSIIKEQDKENPILPYTDTPKGIRIKSSDYIYFLEKCYKPSFNYSIFVENTENPRV